MGELARAKPTSTPSAPMSAMYSVPVEPALLTLRYQARPHSRTQPPPCAARTRRDVAFRLFRDNQSRRRGGFWAPSRRVDSARGRRVRPGPGNRRPHEPYANPSCLCLGRFQSLGLLHELADCVGQSLRVLERHEASGTRSEHVLRVPVRGGDRGATSGDSERERARSDLLAIAIRRDEHIRRREQIGQLVDREEAIVELDVIAEVEIDHASLEHETVLLTLPTCDLRMRAPGDQVQHLGVALNDRGQCRDRCLEALPGGYEPEGGEQKPRLHPLVPSRHGSDVERATSASLLLSPASKLYGRAVRHNSNLGSLAGASLNKQAPRGVGHDDDPLSLLTELREYAELMRCGLRQDCVQRHDERLGQLPREGEHVLAVGTPEDAVFVLEENDTTSMSSRPSSLAART